MRVLLGMILGAIITIGGAYSYDVLTGAAINTRDTAANTTIDGRPMVNWDVVGTHWRNLETSVLEMGQRVHDQSTKRAG